MDATIVAGAVVLDLDVALRQAWWQVVALLFYLGILVVLVASVAYVALGLRLVWLMERIRDHQ